MTEVIDDHDDHDDLDDLEDYGDYDDHDPHDDHDDDTSLSTPLTDGRHICSSALRQVKA